MWKDACHIWKYYIIKYYKMLVIFTYNKSNYVILWKSHNAVRHNKLTDSINVIKKMNYVRDEFKECQGFSRDEVGGFIAMCFIFFKQKS